jgi:signal transduction histidine kinase
LLANISHELRNPLHIILNHAEKLEISPEVTDESTRQIQHNAAICCASLMTCSIYHGLKLMSYP